MNRFAVAFGVAIIGLAIAAGIFYEFGRSAFDAALQERCAKLAEHLFTSVGWRLDGGLVNGQFANYRAHYNARLGKCFMLVATTTIDTRDHSIRKRYELGDVFEQARYAEYFEARTPGLVLFVSPCKFTVPNEKPVFCHSAKEWNRLVKPYIGTSARPYPKGVGVLSRQGHS